ncbi:hypothetical protein WAC35_29145, partial [Klebsiella pneumoniae]
SVFAGLTSFGRLAPPLIILGMFVLIPLIKGFYVLQPNQAAVITLFGSYVGTDRNTGLRWVWPWLGKHKMSVRANNMISEKI